MSWDTEIVTMVRYLINDYSASPTYSDDNLQTYILISAQYVQQENSFDASYTTNIDNLTLKPDPTVGAGRDEAFLWLVSLKTACGILRSELKLVSGQAIAITDEGSSIDLRGTLQGKIQAAKTFCEDYEDARWKWNLGNRNNGEGIFGPFALITPSLYGMAGGFQYYSTRDRPIFN